MKFAGGFGCAAMLWKIVRRDAGRCFVIHVFVGFAAGVKTGLSSVWLVAGGGRQCYIVVLRLVKCREWREGVALVERRLLWGSAD